MSLLNYWPTVEEVNKCIKSEAETVSDEVLLAVHQQFPLAYFKVGPDGKVMTSNKTVATEEGLLSYLLGNAPEGSLVVPITGASGVGKSHIIRLLDARIRHLPNAHRYLVIRLPKSASLRRVVELILEAEPLQHPRYDHLKAEFDKALADVPLHEAVIHFQGQLEISLNEYAASLRQFLNQGVNDQDLKEKLGHAEKLPKLISDATTQEHFRSNVFPRIIQRSVIGVESVGGDIKEIDPTEGQFNTKDLDLHHVNLGQAATPVASYYRLALETREGRGKLVATDVLNAVVDQSIRQLYQLNRSLGGKTLGEVILEIRRLLLKDNRDLVILVEDFAALVGIQDTLAKVLIQEGATGRGQEYATIRSAIAVTDGYLAGRDTLATRAGREWVVESRLESEDALRRTKLLVASYINAARCGENELKRHYQCIFGEVRNNTNTWSPPIYSDDISDEDEEALRSFGYEGDIPLFPFTEAAIECLARSALKLGNDLVFNPRFVIKNIIREVLVSGREAFINKQFPPPVLQVIPPSADVAQWLDSLVVSEDLKQRNRRFVTVWGNNPQSRSDIGRIPGKIFEIFGLQQTDIKPAPQTVIKPRHQAAKPVQTPSSKANPFALAQTQAIEDFRNALENWVQKDVRLEQGIANKIRKALETLINQRIDWNAERCLRPEIKWSAKLSIPNSAGEGNLAADAIKIAPDNKDLDGRLRGELLAILRYSDVYSANKDYEGADDDLARIANLLDRLLPEALEFVRISAQKKSKSLILALAANSRLLGISERGRTIKGVSHFLFSKVETPEELQDEVPQAFSDWKSLQNIAFMVRPQLQQLVLETSGCFQGTGKSVNGIDIIRLVEYYPDNDNNFDLADLELKNLPDLKLSLQNMSDLRVNSRVNQVLQEAKKISSTIKKELGDEFDKNVVIDVLKTLANKLSMGGVWNTDDIGFSAKDFSRLCEEFRSAAVKECLALLQKVEEPDGGGEIQKVVTRVAQLPLSPLITTKNFLEKASKVVKNATRHTQDLELQFQGINSVEKAQELASVFNDLLADLTMLQKGEA